MTLDQLFLTVLNMSITATKMCIRDSLYVPLHRVSLFVWE